MKAAIASTATAETVVLAVAAAVDSAAATATAVRAAKAAVVVAVIAAETAATAARAAKVETVTAVLARRAVKAAAVVRAAATAKAVAVAIRRSDVTIRGGLRAALFVAAAIALIVALVWVWRLTRGGGAIDFYQYYAHARIAGRQYPRDLYDPMAQRELGEELYARAVDGGSAVHIGDATLRRGLDSTATPLLYTLFGWLPKHYELGLELFRILLILAFAGGTLLLARAARIPWTLTLLLTAALVRWFEPLHFDVWVGNVGGFQVLGLALFLAMTRRWPAAAAAILTLTIGFKPNIVPIVILVVVTRIADRDFARLRREAIAGAAAAMCGFLASTLFYRSWDVWLDWLGAARDFYTRLPGREWNNIAPALPFYQRYGTDASTWLTLPLLLIAIALVLRKRHDGLAVALGIAVYLLTAPTVWGQYLVLLVPAAFGLVMAMQKNDGRRAHTRRPPVLRGL